MADREGQGREALAAWFHETKWDCAHRGDIHECVLRASNLLASDWLKAHDAEVAAAALRDAADDENFAATCDHLPWVRLGGHCQCGWLRARADEGDPR